MSLLDLDYTEEQPPSAKKPDYLSRALFFLGVVLFFGGLGYYIVARLTHKTPPPNPEIIYSSDHLTDEEILSSVDTDFNTHTGTASQNLGITESTISAQNMVE